MRTRTACDRSVPGSGHASWRSASRHLARSRMRVLFTATRSGIRANWDHAKSCSQVNTGTTRLDIWLWAARFYRTRSLAKQAVETGKVEVDGQRAKASRRSEEHTTELQSLMRSAYAGICLKK